MLLDEKLTTYALVKSNFNFEPYLDVLADFLNEVTLPNYCLVLPILKYKLIYLVR